MSSSRTPKASPRASRVKRQKRHEARKRECDPLAYFSGLAARRMRQRARKMGLTYNVSAVHVRQVFHQQQGRCFYCDVVLLYEPGRTRGQAWLDRVSIDRVDTHRGYLVDNIVMSCTRCNSLKRDGTPEDFQRILDGIDRCARLGVVRARTRRGRFAGVHRGGTREPDHAGAKRVLERLLQSVVSDRSGELGGRRGATPAALESKMSA